MNTTTFATPSARGRTRARTPSEDEETLVYARGASPAPAQGTLFDEIVHQLSVPLTRRGGSSAPVILTVKPNVFRVPWAPGDPPLPWATPIAPSAPSGRRAPAASAKPTVVSVRKPTGPKKVRRLPARRLYGAVSLLFMMSFGITYGLVRDPVARSSVAAQLRVTAQQACGLFRR